MSRNIIDLHPALREKAHILVQKCAESGLKIQITDCHRNEAEQADCVVRGVSSLKYPKSHHNWGTAFDFCRNDGTGAYNEDGNFFGKVGAIGKSIGLIWGGYWSHPDKPHFQLGEWGTGTAKLIETYKTPAQFKATWVVNPGENTVVTQKDAWIIRLQSAVGTKADGIAGSKTLQACPLLKLSSRGEVVKLLQERLGDYFGIGVQGGYDGIFGRGTEQAVDEFQKQKRLSIDGVVGKNTWRALLEM